MYTCLKVGRWYVSMLLKAVLQDSLELDQYSRLSALCATSAVASFSQLLPSAVYHADRAAKRHHNGG